MKKGLILFLFSILVGQFSFAETDIQLMKGNPSFDPGDDDRSIQVPLMASLDAGVITVSFEEMTASQIVVTNSSDIQVFNQTYSPAFSVQANLSTLPSGSYTIHIYALGYWWYGYFDIY